MAVLKPESAASLLDTIVESIDTKSPANINYVKARMLIEAAGLTRKPKRELKMELVSYLKGEIRHQAPAKPNTVVFSDGTVARF